MDAKKEEQPSTGTEYAKTGTKTPTGAEEGPVFVVYGAEKKSPDPDLSSIETQVHDNKNTLFAKTGTSQAATDASAHEQEATIVYGKKQLDSVSEQENQHWWNFLKGKS